LRILAIDPGTTESGVCVMDNLKPIFFSKMRNEQLLTNIEKRAYDNVVIEMVASYGMPVGAEVFETCVWIGRFHQEALTITDDITYITRNTVKHNICHSSKANDATIKQALVDRFARGQGNHGKGTKKAPGFFYGFKKDIWSAFALGVTYIDLKNRGEL
jgi:hypothetical protein